MILENVNNNVGELVDSQSAFIANRQILDGPFILNELLHWCKRKKKQAMFFRVDFAKAYDSVRWDYLLDVLKAFGFGNNWCKWIRGTFSSAKASVLVNESLNMSLSRAIDEGVFKGIQLHRSISISHLFYADDAMFIGEWSDTNLKGVARSSSIMVQAASILVACVAEAISILSGMVGEWGRLTLLKAVLGASPLFNMSIFKVPKGVLNDMEAIRSKFFNGMDPSSKKITWAAWPKVLASKKNGGLGVSSFHALNRALLLKWVWRFISQDGSLWCRVIKALERFSFREFILFALDLDSEATVAAKMQDAVSFSFRRPVRDGVESQQLVDITALLASVSLSSSADRWVCDLSGDGEFRVKDVRNLLDNMFLPSFPDATRWIKCIPIKINVFVWRARRDFLPTRVNLSRRGIIVDSISCPLCSSSEEDIHHLLFGCDMAKNIFRRLCHWWELDWQALGSFLEWYTWFSSIRLSSKVKALLEGGFLLQLMALCVRQLEQAMKFDRIYVVRLRFSAGLTRQHIDDQLFPSLNILTSWDKALPRKVNIFMWLLKLDRLPHRLNLPSRGIENSEIILPLL
ncbi:RNA-directed DNA polymerase, eukaryota [Tanacetum coccineum]